jgi:hypothetical protein
MPTIDLTDAEHAEVTALIKRAIEDRKIFRYAIDRCFSLLRRPQDVRHAAVAEPCGRRVSISACTGRRRTSSSVVRGVSVDRYRR